MCSGAKKCSIKKYVGGLLTMKQEINCNVKSCRYNNQKNNMCSLQAILVSPVQGKNTQNPDESMCSSYETQQH